MKTRNKKTKSEKISPVLRFLVALTGTLLLGAAIGIGFWLVNPTSASYAWMVSLSVTAYHFAVRVLIAEGMTLLFKSYRGDALHLASSLLFRERPGEKKFLSLLRVRRWRRRLPTARPEQFDVQNRTARELILFACQAEAVHGLSMLFSFLPLVLIPICGEPTVFLITSFLAACLDLPFYLSQRSSLPCLVRHLTLQNKREISSERKETK